MVLAANRAGSCGSASADEFSSLPQQLLNRKAPAETWRIQKRNWVKRPVPRAARPDDPLQLVGLDPHDLLDPAKIADTNSWRIGFTV